MENRPENPATNNTETTEIILVTHALTRWNLENRIQGHTDVPLCREGRSMAEALMHRLRHEAIHAVVTSDLIRARQTAEPLALSTGLTIQQDMRLREGRSVLQERSDQYPTLSFPVEVETEPDVLERMNRAMEEIAASHKGQTVLVVSHGAAVEIFISGLLSRGMTSPEGYADIRMAINRLVYDNDTRQWHCRELNSAAHPADVQNG